MDKKTLEFSVQSEDTNKRIDVYLASVLDKSRAHIQKCIEQGMVLVNDSIVKANYKLRNQDYIKVVPAEPKPAEVVPQDIKLDIVYEDADIIVINKPRGMVVHPAAGVYSGTLVNALLMHCDDLSGINGIIRPGIVHRLDKDTSGVMVAAKNDASHVSLAEQIKQHTARRKYLALVHGNIEEERGTINAPIGRHPIDRKKMAVVFTNSKHAVTHFKVLERFGNYTFIECQLETGRTHQIRVHMSYIGHPVAGDPKYGPKRNMLDIEGQALHSAELVLEHPRTGEKMIFTARLPDDMQSILNKLRKKLMR